MLLRLRDAESYSSAADDAPSFNGITNSQNNVTTIVSEPTLPSRLSERRHLRLNGHLADRPDLFSARAGLQIHETGRSGGGAASFAGHTCIYALNLSGSGQPSLTGKANIAAQCGISR